MSVTRFFTPSPLAKFTPAKAGDVNENLSGIDAGFQEVAAELDAIAPGGAYSAVSAQIGWTTPALGSGEEFQFLSIPAGGWTFPANFSANSGALRGSPPTTDFVISVRHMLASGVDNGEIGTIVIHPDRTISRTTVSGAAVTLPAGGGLLLRGPGTVQAVTYFAERLQPVN